MKHVLNAITCITILSGMIATASAQAASSAPPRFLGQTEGDFIVKDFRFNSGEVLPELRLHYMTLGTVHRDASGAIDNAILLLHSTGGSTSELLNPALSVPLYGPGEPLDLNKFYLIIPDSIGHGKSSKPAMVCGRNSRTTAITI